MYSYVSISCLLCLFLLSFLLFLPLERDDISTGEFYTTLEDQALFETCYPELVKEFTAELDKKGTVFLA